MNLEQQVSNLELSQKLKELGVKQESLFVWYDEDDRPAWRGAFKRTNEIAAFTVSELTELLGNRGIRKISWHTNDDKPFWEIQSRQLYREDKSRFRKSTKGNPLQNALAEHFIWLIENNHVDV